MNCAEKNQQVKKLKRELVQLCKFINSALTSHIILEELGSCTRNYEVRLPKVNRRQRGTRYDSPKLIVGSEVRGTTPQS